MRYRAGILALVTSLSLLAASACSFDKSGVGPEGLTGQPDAAVAGGADANPGAADAAANPPTPDADTQGCSANQMMCGSTCREITADPHHCGGCGVHCGDDEYCSNSSCECRPGLVREMGGNNCVDTSSDPDACGPSQERCNGGDDRCEDGECTDECEDEDLTDCNDACVDTDTDPLNCGACGADCKDHEICVNGSCRDFAAQPSCNGCPCGQCGGGESCTQYPGDNSLTICVD